MLVNSFLEYLFWVAWIVIGLITLIGLFATVQAYRGKFSWGTARYMGITAVLFFWINVIYGLVLVEAAYGVISFFLDLPLWIDIALFLVILAVLMIVYRELKLREKFKSAMFMSLFLIPLGIHGTHMLGKVILLMKPPAKRLILREVPAEKLRPKTSGFPRRDRVGDSGYEIEFRDSVAKGNFGDSLTGIRLTAQGYGEEVSKIDGTHGIDGVYTRYANNGNLQEVLIVENKVDSGVLDPGQMTDTWIDEKVEKLIASGDSDMGHIGTLIQKNPSLVRKQLWRHHLASGETTVSRLDPEAKETSVETYNYIGSATRKICASANPTSPIRCFPVTQ